MPRLTEQEQQEIIRFIEADRPLPEKMARLRQWGEDINRAQTDVEYDFVYVDEESFEKYTG